MAWEKLQWDLVEEILSWVPFKSLARFRTVCKRWNTLFEGKRFAKNHLARACHHDPQFILFSHSKICSVEVNISDVPTIKVHKLTLDIDSDNYWSAVDYCDGLLLYVCKGVALCNPWLQQIKYARPNIYELPEYCGIGYDTSRPNSHYKILVSDQHNNTLTTWITELGSDAWKLYNFESENWRLKSKHGVSLNGTSYWVAYYYESSKYFVQSFDFSMERFKPFCVLPGNKGPDSFYNCMSLSVFRGDRFSFFEQSYLENDIDIWVTKRKINEEEDVEWVKFMNVLVSYRSHLEYLGTSEPPSYFIDHKTGSLVLCYCDDDGQTYIYIAMGDKFYDIKIESLVKPLRHRTYFPSLVQVP